jgi:hypothetical protein
MLYVSRLVWVLLAGLLAGCCCAGVVSGLVGRLLLDGGTPTCRGMSEECHDRAF